MRDIPIYQLARVFAKRRKIYKTKAEMWGMRSSASGQQFNDEMENQYRFAVEVVDKIWSDISQLGEKE